MNSGFGVGVLLASIAQVYSCHFACRFEPIYGGIDAAKNVFDGDINARMRKSRDHRFAITLL